MTITIILPNKIIYYSSRYEAKINKCDPIEKIDEYKCFGSPDLESRWGEIKDIDDELIKGLLSHDVSSQPLKLITYINYKLSLDFISVLKEFINKLININIDLWKRLSLRTDPFHEYFSKTGLILSDNINFTPGYGTTCLSRFVKKLGIKLSDDIKARSKDATPSTCVILDCYEIKLHWNETDIIELYSLLKKIHLPIAESFICRCFLSPDTAHIMLHSRKILEMISNTPYIRLSMMYGTYLLHMNEFMIDKKRHELALFTLDQATMFNKFNHNDLGENPFVLFRMIEDKSLKQYLNCYLQRDRKLCDQAEFNLRLSEYKNIDILLSINEITVLTGSVIINTVVNYKKANYISSLANENRLDYKYKDLLDNFDVCDEYYESDYNTILKITSEMDMVDGKIDEKMSDALINPILLLSKNQSPLVKLCNQLNEYTDLDIPISCTSEIEFEEKCENILSALKKFAKDDSKMFVYMIPKISIAQRRHYIIVNNIFPFHLELFMMTVPVEKFIHRFHFPITRVWYNTKTQSTHLYHSGIRAYLTGINYEVNANNLATNFHLFSSAYKYAQKGIATVLSKKMMFDYIDYIKDKKDKTILGGAIHKNHSIFNPDDSDIDDTIYPIIYTSAKSIRSKYGVHLLTSTSVTVPDLSIFDLLVL